MNKQNLTCESKVRTGRKERREGSTDRREGRKKYEGKLACQRKQEGCTWERGRQGRVR